MAKLSQRKDERLAFVNLMRAEGVRSYLEIGLRLGHTFAYVGEHLPRGSKMVGVDLPGFSPWGVEPDEVSAARSMIKAQMRSLGRFGQHVFAIWGNSTDPKTVEKVRQHGPYDLVFIDGDHSAEGVRADWANYGPMARLVAFHDIDAENGKLTPERLAEYGVHQLWAELTTQYWHEELIGWKRGMGIGVLWRKK